MKYVDMMVEMVIMAGALVGIATVVWILVWFALADHSQQEWSFVWECRGTAPLRICQI